MFISHGIFSGLISMFSWGVADFFAAKSSRKIGAVLTLFWTKALFVFIALVLYFFLGFQEPDIEGIFKFLPVILLAGFLSAIAGLAFFKGLVIGNVSIVSPIGASYALIIVLLSAALLNETLKTNQLIGVILIILGIPLISINLKEILKIKKVGIFSGAKEGLIAMFGWGLALFLIISVCRDIGWFFPIFILNLSVLLFLTGYMLLSKHSLGGNFQPGVWVWLFLIALLDALAWFAYGYGVTMEYASIVAPIAAAFPIITIILARIFLKEKLVLNQILGISGVIMGLILISI